MKRVLALFVCGLLTASCMTACKKEVQQDDNAQQENQQAEIITSKDVTPTPVPEQEAEVPQGEVISYLTGEYVSAQAGRRRPVAVMLSNIKEGCPQSGIAKAAVVYEAPTEGDITRLMGIFEEYDDLEKIGSVRSCRDYYIFYAQEFESIYAHYGQAVYALPYLEQDFIQNLSGLEAVGDQVYYRTTDRKAPHNAYTSFEGIQAGIRQMNYTQEYSADYDGHYQFAEPGGEVTIENGDSANTVRLECFSVNHPWFEYDSATGKYKRFQYQEPQIDDLTGEQLAYDNIILQYSDYKPYDPNGYLNIDAVSGGQGKFITRGKAEDIRWEKESPWGVTHYYDSEGQEITLNTGKTWVAVVLNDEISQVSIQ